MKLLTQHNLSTEEWVTSLASISYAKEQSKSPTTRFKALLTESVNNTPARPIEFAPQVLDTTQPVNRRFGFMHNGKFYTNLRNVINSGLAYSLDPIAERDLYVVIKLTVPYFVFAQLYTHNTLTKQAVSERYTTTTPQIWLPEDISARSGISREEWEDNILNRMSLTQIQKAFKDLGYPREIYQRYPQMAVCKTFIIGGWIHDPLGFKHLIAERSRSHTQAHTRAVVQEMRQLLNDYIVNSKLDIELF